MFSLDDLDVTKACEKGFEFEVTDDANGKGVGIFLTIVGAHSERITEYTKKALNERRVEEAMAQKRDPRGKRPNVVPIEEDIEFSTELVALRITGWRGIKEEYSHANAVRLCKINPSIKEQILKESDNLANFPTTFSPNSDSTSGTQPG